MQMPLSGEWCSFPLPSGGEEVKGAPLHIWWIRLSSLLLDENERKTHEHILSFSAQVA